jgi:hypothetical protein
VASALSVHDFRFTAYHNGAARTVTLSANVGIGVTALPITDCTGLTGGEWVNRPITKTSGTHGFGIQLRTFVTSITSGPCTVNLNKATNVAMTAGQGFKIDNADARQVSDAVINSGSATITSATANFLASDIGKSVSGTEIPNNTTITAVGGGGTTATMSVNADGTSAASTITIGGTQQVNSTRSVNDATYGSTTTVTSPLAGFVQADDVGLPVYGTGIAAGAYITAVAGTTITLGPGTPVTVDALTHTIAIGDASTTAPANGDTVATMGLQIDLDPGFVAGSRPCTDDEVEGVHTVATWRNPGSFLSGLFSVHPSARVLGQVNFITSVSTFSMWIVERPASPAAGSDTTISAKHYDLMANSLPVTSALCASATSPGLALSIGVQGNTSSQGALPLGVGRPGSAQLRYVLPDSDGGYNATAFVKSDDPFVTFSPAGNFSRLCAYPVGPPLVGFGLGTGCGNG